jgi:hypothetical protein
MLSFTNRLPVVDPADASLGLDSRSVGDPDLQRRVCERIGEILRSEQANPARAIDRILELAVRFRLGVLGQYLSRVCGATVQGGPFASLKYLEQSTAESVYLPKLMGTYEAEVHPALARISQQPYETVVNIGCGEGYYAVGLARLLPAARVLAFDSDPGAQELCRHLAGLNGVAGRVVVGGECSLAQLRELARPRTLIVCDVEGAEARLLDLQQVPGLTSCDLLVELHDCIHPGLSALICRRFQPTHDAQMLNHGGRNPYAIPALKDLIQFNQFLAVLEARPGPTPWVFLSAREAGSGP